MSKQLCHLLSAPVGNALLEPILQCVPRYTAIRLVGYELQLSVFGPYSRLANTVKSVLCWLPLHAVMLCEWASIRQ